MFEKELLEEYKENIYAWKLGSHQVWRTHVYDWEVVSFAFLVGVFVAVGADLLEGLL